MTCPVALLSLSCRSPSWLKLRDELRTTSISPKMAARQSFCAPTPSPNELPPVGQAPSHPTPPQSPACTVYSDPGRVRISSNGHRNPFSLALANTLLYKNESQRLRMPLPPHLHTPLQEIITRLILHSTNTQPKRIYSELFQELPDKTYYADYYVLIREPRSLNGVLVSSTKPFRRKQTDGMLAFAQASLNKGMYSSPQIVAYDLLLIWSNARTYNQEGSLVYADADKLEVRST